MGGTWPQRGIPRPPCRCRRQPPASCRGAASGKALWLLRHSCHCPHSFGECSVRRDSVPGARGCGGVQSRQTARPCGASSSHLSPGLAPPLLRAGVPSSDGPPPSLSQHPPLLLRLHCLHTARCHNIFSLDYFSRVCLPLLRKASCAGQGLRLAHGSALAPRGVTGTGQYPGNTGWMNEGVSEQMSELLLLACLLDSFPRAQVL